MTLLFVMNFGSGTGYAWETIEGVFRRLSERLSADGVHCLACYPDLRGGPPRQLAGSPIEVLEFDYAAIPANPPRLLAFLRLLRRHRVSTLYLTDQPTWSPYYPLYHLAGVRRIIVHDRNSGDRSRRSPPVEAIKRAIHRVPWLAADCFIGVSEFVADRLRRVNGTPPERTHRVYNGIDFTRFESPGGPGLTEALGLPATAKVVFASGRAQPYKGIPVLIDAAALIQEAGYPEVHFAYAGDGPALAQFRQQAAARGLSRFHFLGRREDVPRLLSSATLAVVPSVWAEAFGLTVVEAMAAGRPVVASNIGGIPELVSPGETGLLVPPNQPAELARAICRLLDDEPLRTRMGDQARAAAHSRFSMERTAEELYQLVRQ